MEGPGGSGPGGAAAAAAAAGFDQDEVQALILSCNKDGMESLRRARAGRGQDPLLKTAFEQFKYAEAMLLAKKVESEDTALLAVTCNNLGCYYKKVGKYHCALSYLRRALKMEVELRADEVTLASTHLNLCAILSKLEKHDKAVQHALQALDLMSKRVGQSDTVVSEDDYAVLAIAYHNVAMEREFLQQWDQAVTAFQTGFQVAKRLLGENHPLTITLGKNCEAVQHKAKNTKAKVKPGHTRGLDAPEGGEGGSLSLVLPPLAASSPRGAEMPRLQHSRTARHEAADWVKGEEALWVNFAQKALGSTNAGSALPAILAPQQRDLALSGSLSEAGDDHGDVEGVLGLLRPKPQPLAVQALRELQDVHHTMPKAHDMGALRFVAVSQQQLLRKTPLAHALDSNPEALMDLIEAEGEGQPSMRSAPNDFRPHRTMKRSTRTSVVVRRTGVFNSTTHRDRVEADLERKRLTKAAPWKSAHAQKLAAERIQRVWRSWYQYCQENSEWMTITWICATMIQSHWRSYHVRRQRMDRAASLVQRRIRGFLVRSVLRKHTAAVTIQRHIAGVLTRKRMRHFHESATQIQRLVRGGLARRHFRELRHFKFSVVITIQRHVRAWMARRVAGQLAEEKRKRLTLLKATIDLQRLFRGWKGRHRALQRRAEYEQAKREYEAATKLQNVARGIQARKRVEALREIRLQEMEKAATFLRKVWIGARTRKKYLQLRREFKGAEDKIITIQRYVRGCMCRLKMWREAVRTEEELWAVIEVQRAWRGYHGRVRWEQQYEAMWRREMGAALLQRNVRGWLARTRINRVRRKLARTEFENARERFRAAQKLQALVRGVLNRKRTRLHRARAAWAAVQIQRIARGRALRSRMWRQVVHQRATMITALARGFLIRRRRYRLMMKVVCIQRAYRRWLQRSPEERRELRDRVLDRKKKATTIQRHFRLVVERKTLQRLAAPAA